MVDRPTIRSHDAKRPMRVVDIISLSSSAHTLLRARVLAMRARGIDNRIICMDGPHVAALRAAGIPVHTVTMPRRLDGLRLVRSLIELTTLLRRLRVDLVHTHCSIPGLVGRLAARLAGVPVAIHTVHGFHFHERMPAPARALYVWAERACGWMTDTLLTQTRGDLEQAERHRIGPEGRRRCVGNGIDLSRFRPVPPRSRADGPVILTCVARFEPVKNHGLLFEAARLLRRRGERFRIRLVGEGPLRREYEARCRRLGIDDLVEFLGYREDVPALLATTDIAVLTSIKEGLPRAALEAMAMGLPVVATRVPGTREAVRHGETGLTVPLGEVDELAAALALLIGDPGLRARMGARGRRVAVEAYDERIVAETLRRIYQARRPVRSTARAGRIVTGACHDGLGAASRANR